MTEDKERTFGDIMRREYLLLAEQWKTPIPYWEGMTMRRFARWIRSHNEVMRERHEKNSG